MKRFFQWAPILLLLIFVLCGCGEQTAPPEVSVSYTVAYMVGDSLYTTQTVAQGEYPAPVTAQMEGVEITGWLDEGENPVQPETVPVTRNMRYTAQVSPRLTRHMPYLTLDEYGFLHPDEPLTGQALRAALQALSEETAWAYFPALPEAETLRVSELKTVLSTFLTEGEVDAVVDDNDTDTVTRAMFASYVHTLLGRNDQETFILAASAQMPWDVTALRTDTVALLEASVRHTSDPEGQTWADLEMPTGWDPGFVMVDGWLYYVQPDGKLLRDGKMGSLYFGTDGRYTSGDQELDALVADILKNIMENNPELEGLELLRKVFDHCHQDYVYLRKEAYDFGATGWEVEDAKEMILKGRGNCYNFAAIFWALASGMGYDVQCLAGTCTGTDQPHGWVVLHYDGVDYFVDPEWQYAYTEREIFDKDMFMLTMDEVWWWTYRWDETQFSA